MITGKSCIKLECNLCFLDIEGKSYWLLGEGDKQGNNGVWVHHASVLRRQTQWLNINCSANTLIIYQSFIRTRLNIGLPPNCALKKRTELPLNISNSEMYICICWSVRDLSHQMTMLADELKKHYFYFFYCINAVLSKSILIQGFPRITQKDVSSKIHCYNYRGGTLWYPFKVFQIVHKKLYSMQEPLMNGFRGCIPRAGSLEIQPRHLNA